MPKPMASAIEAMMKMRWNALRDISMSDGVQWKVVQTVQRKAHQSDEEKHCERKHAVDHFLLRNEMHEIACHKKRFHARDHEGENDVPMMAEIEIRGPHGEDRADKQRKINEQITANGMRFVSCIVAHKIKAGREPGTKISRRGQRSARTGRRLRFGS
jgi:hypothetical protein